MKSLAIAAALLLAACANGDTAQTASSPRPEAQGRAVTIEANISVWSDLDAQPKKPWTTGVDCTSYDFDGVRVQVLDGSQTILGVASFPTKGTWTKSEPKNTGSAYQWDGICTWSTTVDELIKSNVYVVELDGWESMTYDADELDAKDWTVSLDL